MRRAVAALLLGAFLTACGVEGDPARPPAPEGGTTNGVTVSGDARIGLRGRL